MRFSNRELHQAKIADGSILNQSDRNAGAPWVNNTTKSSLRLVEIERRVQTLNCDLGLLGIDKHGDLDFTRAD